MKSCLMQIKKPKKLLLPLLHSLVHMLGNPMQELMKSLMKHLKMQKLPTDTEAAPHCERVCRQPCLIPQLRMHHNKRQALEKLNKAHQRSPRSRNQATRPMP